MKEKFIDYFMEVAASTANLSYCNRLKVGCVVVKDRRIISIGYNGTPPGHDNCCEDEIEDENGIINLKTKSTVLHAEENALMKLCSSHDSSYGATMFITHEPCYTCSRLILSSGIKTVIYKNHYKNSGIEFLKQSGVEIIKYEGKINV